MNRRDAQRVEFFAPRFGDVDPPQGVGLAPYLEAFGQLKAFLRGQRTDPIDPGSVLAAVVLSDPTDSQQLGRSVVDQELLELTDSLAVASG
jgi:hypothetical protein